MDSFSSRLLMVCAMSFAMERRLTFEHSLWNGMVSVNTISSKAESSMRCIAGPERMQWEAMARTLLAPMSLMILAAIVMEPAVSTISSTKTTSYPLLSKDIDCITNLTDNTVVGALDIILPKTNAKKIPVFGSEIDQVKSGCLASASLDYAALGKRTGEIMGKVLKGEAKASNDIAIKIDDSFNCYSAKVAEALDITLPDVQEMRNVD